MSGSVVPVEAPVPGDRDDATAGRRSGPDSAAAQITGHDRGHVERVVVLDRQSYTRHDHPGSDDSLHFVSGEGDPRVEDDEGDP